MELRQLRYLVALADERSFTRAAEREHIAQPALSQQIRRLEQEVGVPLVERTTRRVAITDAGQMLVSRARRMMGELDAATNELNNFKGVQTGHLSIGAMHTTGPIDISLPISIFHKRHPQVDLTIREGYSERLAERLRDDAIDLAFLSVTERIESHGLGLHLLLTEELVLALEPDHPLARRGGPVRIAELAGERFIAYRRGARLREVLEEASRAAGFEALIAVESNENPRILALVRRGFGVAILPRSDVLAAVPHVAWVPLIEPKLTRDVTLAWRASRHQPPAVVEFRTIALETFSPELVAKLVQEAGAVGREERGARQRARP